MKMSDAKNEHAKRERAYRRAANDDEAARMLGLSTPTFAAWRLKRGLKSKRPRGRPFILTKGGKR